MKKTLILLTLASLALFTACNSRQKAPEVSNDAAQIVLNNIFSRKSVRSYTDQPVPDEMVETLLRAAMSAPSGMNVQPWHFVVVNTREMLDRLAKEIPNRMLETAPLAIVVCGETMLGEGRPNNNWKMDASAATENLLLAAEAMGLGAVWTAADYDARADAVIEVLGIPSNVRPLCVVPIGFPAGNDQPKDKWKPERIHYNKW
ncbi:MAG: nitroreductase family protein [Bacteroidales bacterium]|nr:nitroreductase family protein [Bacteroidales bacterium]